MPILVLKSFCGWLCATAGRKGEEGIEALLPD
jgi:hypothetical protein